jgi:hypothetical protein
MKTERCRGKNCDRTTPVLREVREAAIDRGGGLDRVAMATARDALTVPGREAIDQTGRVALTEPAKVVAAQAAKGAGRDLVRLSTACLRMTRTRTAS